MSVLKVAVDRILSITEARRRLNGLVDEVAQQPEGMYVLTKGGAPVVAVVSIDYIERLMAGKSSPPQVTQGARQELEVISAEGVVRNTREDEAKDGENLTVIGGLADSG